MDRKIIHIDMDAFYAAVEQRDNPAYRGQPIAVGGAPDRRGAVAAASYEARKYGVYSAIPSRLAQQKCPHLIFVKPRFEVYRAISGQIRAVFERYTDQVEPVALDEAYLDVTENHLGSAHAIPIAKAIKAEIYAETGLTASAGVSVNKFLAKMASGLRKPDGLWVILPEQAADFVAGLPIGKFHGIGTVTAAKMQALGIYTGADLRQWAEADLVAKFGKAGRFYAQIAQGLDERPVVANRIRKSVGAETSYDPDLRERSALDAALDQVVDVLHQRLASQQVVGRTLTLKVKFADYQQITRSRTVAEALRGEAIRALARELWAGVEADDRQLAERQVRLLGLSVSNLGQPIAPAFVQLSLAGLDRPANGPDDASIAAAKPVNDALDNAL
jgi:DNA polymerase IV